MAPPKTIAGFEVEREIGRGGMGVVFLARQPTLDRSVVLKSLRRECAEDPQLVARFEREAQAAAGVSHQNVVAVHDCFAWRGRWYICQEHVDGTDLGAALASGRLEPRIAGLIALEIARGLEAVSARGIVHRDLKPSNVLISRAGEVKIADFGIALDATAQSLTQTGHAVGTPRYMSPEQLYGERADGRSDIFALGVVMYEMCTGMAPFEGDETDEDEALVRRIEAERCPTARALAPRTPRALSRIIATCLRAKPKRRWSSASHLRSALERHLGSPTSPESQAEIAHWLADKELIEIREEQTVVALPVEDGDDEGTAGGRWRWAAVLAALVGFALAAWLLDQRGALPIRRLPTPLPVAANLEDSAERLAYSLISDTDVSRDAAPAPPRSEP